MLASSRLRPPSLRAPGSVLAGSIIVFGLWILSPSLQAGWSSDDFVFQAIMDGAFAVPRHPLDLFNFADGTPRDAAALRQHAYPWWTPDSFKIRMLRPLASALIWFDRTAFGDRVWLHHVHSLAWWLVLLLGACRLYRGRFVSTVAMPALFVYTLDTSHHTPVMWLANRGGLASVALGVWALLAHLRWRESGARTSMLASALLFSLALLCGEWIFCVFAYVFSYELLKGTGSRLRRMLALLPSVLPALAFVAAREVLHYGVSSSGVYSDPIGQPLRFLVLLWQRIAVFFADMILDVPADWWSSGSPWRDRILQWQIFSPSQWARMPGWETWHVLLGSAGAVIALFALRASWRDSEPETRSEIRWLVVGALLALVPVAGSFPSRRLVIVSMLGVAPALAMVMRALARGLVHAAVGGRTARFAGLWCALGALVELHFFAPLRIDLNEHARWVRTAEYWVKHAELDPTRVASQAAVIVSSRDFITTTFFPSTWRDAERPLPRAVYTLSFAPYAHRLRRTADDAFELDVLGGSFLGTDVERHFRAPSLPLPLGARVKLEDMTAEVVRMHDDLPRTVSFTFRESLDSDRYVFLSAQPGGIIRVEMPKLGEAVLLPRAVAPDFMAHARRRYELLMGPFPRFLLFDPVPDFVTYRAR